MEPIAWFTRLGELMTQAEHLFAQAERYRRVAELLRTQGGDEFLERMARGYHKLATAAVPDSKPMAGPPR